MRSILLLAVLTLACGGDKDAPPAPVPAAKVVVPPPVVPVTPKPTVAERPDPAPPVQAGSGAAPSMPQPPAVVAPEGNPPADGKYERVMVEGVTVPMIEIMQGGTVVLVDTDGKKPRTWEEQYKRKRSTGRGQLDVHKTDANKNGKFDDDAIDREGLWVIDDKGNITKH